MGSAPLHQDFFEYVWDYIVLDLDVNTFLYSSFFLFTICVDADIYIFVHGLTLNVILDAVE